MQWFDVDKEGLAKLVERRGKSFIIDELYQNAVDEDISYFHIETGMLPNRPRAKIVVSDDSPTGFRDLTHAFTLFAESYKKDNPTQRGRFNLGEKLVLAICEEAEISSTTGTVVFDKNGRKYKSVCRSSGTQFRAIVRMTRSEFNGLAKAVKRLIVPEGIEVTFNGDRVESRKPVFSIEASLPTEISDTKGFLRRTTRKTRINLYEPRCDETACVYEMGIPVVETGDKYHYDILQKVPLNFDRDNVPPSYLKKLRAIVLNETSERLTEDEVQDAWVREGFGDVSCHAETAKKIVQKRYGEKCAVYDPSNPESAKSLIADGYRIVYGRDMTKREWENVKAANAIPSASQIARNNKPFDSEGKELKKLPEKDWTPGIKAVVKYAKELAKRLINHEINVVIANDSTWPFAGSYGGEYRTLHLNVGRLGYKWFVVGTEELDDLLIHEYAHEYESDHLSEGYYKALSKLGARLKRLALEDPTFFHRLEKHVL